MKLLKRKLRSFDIQVQDLVLHISAGGDVNEESRAAALSFWEQLQAYALRNPAVRTSKRPIRVPEDAPPVVRELVRAAGTAGVGPMFSFRGALTDHVGRFLARSTSELTVSCGGDYFIVARKRRKLTVHRTPDGRTIAVVVRPSREGVGVSTAFGSGRAPVDGLAVLASSCMLADAAAAGVQALLSKPDGFHVALDYLKKVPGVDGGLLLQGDRIGVAGGVEIAA
ncbi:MAG: hypothetical protein ACE14W_04295 [Candidatus Velamenicoccus archaeovorus]